VQVASSSSATSDRCGAGADCDCGPLGYVEVPLSFDLAANVDAEIKGSKGGEKDGGGVPEFLIAIGRVRYAAD
jgi:hypothetical protein